MHDPFGSNLSFHDDMHVTHADMRSQQVPTAMRTVVAHDRQHGCSALLIELVWLLRHSLVLRQGALRIGFQEAGSEPIVEEVDRARFIAMQACAITREGDEIPQVALSCGRGSAMTVSLF